MNRPGLSEPLAGLLACVPYTNTDDTHSSSDPAKWPQPFGHDVPAEGVDDENQHNAGNTPRQAHDVAL
ncbi:unnamed protein product [Anisakis simplex]|uniref:Uncharacterized protein n=1 Tax=Anisakis simplex TaxID=6269 RepID=A0A3P6PJJ8_ANISI|nr:unnamed protein product [Anisakis simplex]